MVEPSGHCPYLGLKQNRAIRFASPTSEHRCYVSGEAREIPVSQSSYCLSQEHVSCPLYNGLELASTPEGVLGPVPEPPAGGLGSWVGSLSPRDRLIYVGLVALLLLTVLGFGLAALQLLDGQPIFAGNRRQTASPLPAQGGGADPQRAPTQALTPTLAPSQTPLPIPNDPAPPPF